MRILITVEGFNVNKLSRPALSALALCLMLSGQSVFAASKADQKTSELKTQIAIEYIKIGNLDSAKLALDEALKKDSSNAAATMTMAITYQLVGTRESMELAEQYFKKAVELDSKNPQIRNNYGQFLFVNERYEEAIEQLKIAANAIGYINRDNALNNLAQTHLKTLNFKDAKLYFLRALQINPRMVEALYGLSETYYALNDLEASTEVLEDYIQAIGKDRLDAKGTWLAMRIHKANGDAIQLREYTKLLTEKYPKSDEYRRYMKQKDSKQKWS